MTNIRITLLANAGVLVQFRETGILVDAIHSDATLDFSPISPQVLQALLAGEPPLHNVGHLLYTHGHADHFTARHNELYLSHRRPQSMVLPRELLDAHSAFRWAAESRVELLYPLEHPLGAARQLELDEGMTCTAIRSVHMGKQYAHVPHYCLLLSLGGRQLLFLADSEPDGPYLGQMLGDTPVHMAFVNPLHLNTTTGRAAIAEHIRPKRLAVYHLPFQEKDDMQLRKMTLRNLEKHGDKLPPAAVLWNEYQQILL